MSDGLIELDPWKCCSLLYFPGYKGFDCSEIATFLYVTEKKTNLNNEIFKTKTFRVLSFGEKEIRSFLHSMLILKKPIKCK